ncbi:MAG: SMC family ATPase [Candidatus Nanopelagicales bacterium]
MKLQRLEFVGIGSFADRMEIDFTALGSAGMFLVEGPTGSGKSTILDAIVFALYGGVAGSGSDLGRLDSHLRDRQQEPYVELDFACGPDSYRIRRTPRHERDKRRGEGTMRDEGSVSLIQLTPAQAAISHKAKEVGDWVIEHVGLTKQQFVSTIVLAQGEFATFLDADTGSRAQILEKVFGTQFYKHVEDQLASMRRAAIERRTDAVRAVDEVRNRCLGVLGLEADADIPEAAGQVHADLRQAQEELTRADIAQAQAQEQHAAAQALVSQQQRKQSLLIRQRDLAAEQEPVEQAREALSAHDRAVPAVAAIAAWRRAKSELEIGCRTSGYN